MILSPPSPIGSRSSVVEMRQAMRHRPRTMPGQRFPLDQMDHQAALFNLCYFLTLPECLLRTILRYLDVPGLIRLAATSKAFKRRMSNSGIFFIYPRVSQFPLVRLFEQYVERQGLVTLGLPAMRYPFVLEHNLDIMVRELSKTLEEGCQRVKTTVNRLMRERAYLGYYGCVKSVNRVVPEIIFLELLALKLGCLRTNDSLLQPALAVDVDGQGKPILKYANIEKQNKGNMRKILSCFRHRTFSCAGGKIRSTLFPITPGLRRYYSNVYHTTHINLLLNLVCRPDLLQHGIVMTLPNGDIIEPTPGMLIFPPPLANGFDGQIVDVESDSDNDGDDAGDLMPYF